MAMKKAAKKSKRRLKRSVRRSLAAVLMITAIGVAAVPVPENYADNGDAARSVTRAADVHDKELENYGYADTLWKEIKLVPKKDENGDPITGDDGNPVMEEVVEEKRDRSHDEPTSTGTNGGSIKLDKYAGKDIEELFVAWENKEVMASLATTDVGGGIFDLCWQFLFYEVTEPESHADRGVICKYNNQYSTDNLELGMKPITEYYVVEEDRFEAYYDENYNLKVDDTGAVTGEVVDKTKTTHAKVMKSMKIDPTVGIEFRYADFLDGGVLLGESALNFLQTYCKAEYDSKVREFQQYQTALNNYKPDSGAAKPDEPKPLVKVPTNVLSMEQKLKFFCDQDKNLEKYGSGYTLCRVSDSRPKVSNTGNPDAGDGSNAVYMAQGGKPLESQGASNDKNGFLAIGTSPYLMCAIGNQAFKGVSKVVNLVIPSMIGYIGDEAFADAALMESIQIDNVAKIGNRAFKGCVKLATVKIAQGTEVIGADCFSGTAITEINLPTSITTIGYGAFSKCQNLATINLNNMKSACEVKEYAFYNCTALSSVEMADSAIVSIGEGAFAVEGGSLPMGITLPKGMSDAKSIGNFMFAGRSSLEYVVFPQNYGRSATPVTKIPDSVFHRCVNLQYVEFPTDQRNDPQACGFVQYTPEMLFADVINPDFYVKGPKTNTQGDPAYPRTSTWDAKTAVSDTVPYLYIENGVEYYEVSDGTYLLCINDKGILTSCTFKPGLDASKKKNVRLVIPAVVGHTKVVGIASGCFSDSELNENVISLTIMDESISEIANGVFQGGGGTNSKDWQKLEKVYIGNSVTAIGDNAFKDCTSLVDVTFNSPLGGHEAFKIGTDAFKTESGELTFHGDIVQGYAPFEWATDPNNVIQTQDGIRVCYKSLSPTYLTVMYNPITEKITLLDYPKYSEVSEILNDAHEDEIKRKGFKTYEEMKVAEWYDRYRDRKYDEDRKNFALAWQAAEEPEAVYGTDLFGPWINAEFCARWDEWFDGNPDPDTSTDPDTPDLPDSGDGGDTAFNTLTDWLFEPITVHAMDSRPQPYYTVRPYNVIDIVDANDPYRAPTAEEQGLVYSTKNIVVPEGVDSIDVYGYIKNYDADGEPTTGVERNTGNYNTYLRSNWTPEIRRMYESATRDENDTTEIVPGLFSGYFKDYDDTTDREKYARGNDLIESITLNSVDYLPDYAFDSCENLRYVILGPACADIGKAPFRGCYSMTMVGDNDYYTTVNGIIYSKNTDGSYTIEECLSARGRLTGQASVSVASDPDLANVSTIKPGAFEDCDDITSVSFGREDTKGLSIIPEDCFKNCDKLQSVILPITTNDVEKGVFVGSNNLTSLTIYGKEVKISGSAFENSDENQKVKTTVRTYKDSAVVRYVKEYGDAYLLELDEQNPLGEQWLVSFLDYDHVLMQETLDKEGNAISNPQYVEDGAYATVPQPPVREGWTFEQWAGMNHTAVDEKIHEDTIFYAQGHSDDGMINGKYMVEFYDGVDGKKIGPTQYIEPGADAIAPSQPVHAGYAFDKWSDSYTNIQANKSIVALYKATTSGGSTNNGGSTNSSRNSSSNKTSSKTSSSTSTTSSSTASTSTTSSTGSVEMYSVTVIGGSGSGSYAKGAPVVITASTPAAGSVFSKWVTESPGVSLASVSTTPTTFTMPGNNVTITAEYTEGTAPATTTPAAGTTSTGTSSRPSNDTGNTRVDITKPGISNKDLATANVNGATDNFIIKISETDEATKAVADALTNEYGSLDNILYYAMDISLYDATGTTKITDTAGISVDITIPIPDALIAYGGNNMAGAVVNGNQLEKLNENFTTINGVPCIRFTASHFSPYTIYVDTGNLTEGMLDTTPKTGDPIHPKWFLSIGLACLSIILFMKKDKRTKVKTA